MNNMIIEDIIRVNRETNLIITDPWYLEDVEPILIADNQADGLYDVCPVIGGELGDSIGTVGVDTCQVAIFKKKDIPKKQLNNLKPFLYTELPRFKGQITYCKWENETIDDYALAFKGKETSFILYF